MPCTGTAGRHTPAAFASRSLRPRAAVGAASPAGGPERPQAGRCTQQIADAARRIAGRLARQNTRVAGRTLNADGRVRCRHDALASREAPGDAGGSVQGWPVDVVQNCVDGGCRARRLFGSRAGRAGASAPGRREGKHHAVPIGFAATILYADWSGNLTATPTPARRRTHADPDHRTPPHRPTDRPSAARPVRAWASAGSGHGFRPTATWPGSGSRKMGCARCRSRSRSKA